MIDLSSGKTLSRAVKTTAEFRNLSRKEIDMYLDQDPDFMRYALGYDPEANYSMSFITRIECSYNNILHGIPLEVMVEMLKEIGHKI